MAHIKRNAHVYLTITNPMAFLKENFGDALSIFDHATTVKEWVNIGWIDLPLEFDVEILTTTVLKRLDEVQKELEAKYILDVQALAQKRQEFLALTFDVQPKMEPEVPPDFPYPVDYEELIDDVLAADTAQVSPPPEVPLEMLEEESPILSIDMGQKSGVSQF